MNIPELQQKLIAAARASRPSEDVPYAFEHRIMALIQDRPVSDIRALWARALWKAATPCLAVALVLGAWSAVAPSLPATSTDLSQDFDSTLLAAAEQQAFDTTW